MKERKRRGYDKDMPQRLYRFFIGYDEVGAPSIEKFARSVGMTTRAVEEMRSHKRFDQAYLECQRIRRDYLIDRALERKFDPSFTKFLLQGEDEESREAVDRQLHFCLEVKE